MFGGINPKNSQVSMGGITEHETAGWFDRFAAKGMRCINIGPQRDDAPGGLRMAAAAPGLGHRADAGARPRDRDRGADRPGLPRALHRRLRPLPPLSHGRDRRPPKSPEWAAPLCGADPEAIRALARRMATTRTLVTLSWSLQRGEHGEQPYWMSVVLAAMLGQIGLPGGGVGYGYGAIGGVGRSLLGLRGMTLPQGRNPVRTVIPVARIADMLRNPGPALRLQRPARTLPRHPADLLGRRQPLPPPPGPERASTRPGSGRRRSSSTSRGGPRPPSGRTSSFRRRRPTSARTSGGRTSTTTCSTCRS